MGDSLFSRIKRAWNVFMNKDPTMGQEIVYNQYTYGSSYRPDRIRLSRGSERSIATSVYNRLAIDVASIGIKHVRLDKNGRYAADMNSRFNECLTLSANKDQIPRAFFQDVVMSMLDEGCVAIVPVDTTDDPGITNSFDILSLRTGRILEWYPDAIKAEVYNDQKGKKEELYLYKRSVAIVENPLYSIINEPNSTMQRLIRKLALLDVTDEQNSSGKLDLIVQLPYVLKTTQQKEQAEARRKSIEDQLVSSKYGIAYTDGTERIVQLNRSVENNLMSQVEYLTSMLYSQLGITQSVLDGTADETTMLNYYNRSVEPILSAIIDEMKRKFLTRTAITQGQSILFFRDPFRLVPINNIAEIADKFTRNEIMTSNEIRQVVGLMPSEDPSADELRNKNLNQSAEDIAAKEGIAEEIKSEEDVDLHES